MSQYLSEAFKKLDLLNEDTFTISDNGLEDFVKFRDEDEFDDSIDVIDPEATTVDELQDSYIGKVILDCCVCHSKIYKDVEDVIIEDDIANANEECPFCYTTDGYKVVGQVASFGEEEKETEETEEVEEEDDNLEEGLFGKKSKGTIKEIKATELKKGDTVVDDDGSEDKVVSVEDAGSHVDVSFKHGSSSIPKNNSVKIRESIEISESYKDTSGIMGEVDAIYTEEELEDYFDNNKDNDPSLAAYKGNKSAWLKDTFSNMSQVDESLTESVNNVNVETDEDIINVTTDDTGKVTVSTEPKANSTEGEEVITPLEPETQTELSDNVEDGGEIEIDMDEFDEESFDELGESYLKKVYENVDSFRTSKVSFIKDKLILEGVIRFNSGKSKKTNFIFESREATKSGKVRFIGENKEIAKGKKSFTVTGKMEGSKFLSESLNYNYGVKDSNGKSQRLYGTVRTKKVGK